MSGGPGLLGLGPAERPAFARLSGVLALTTSAEFLVEGVVTSAFLARIGARELPVALAIRAVAEAIFSLLYERASSRLAPRRALLGVVALGAPLLALAAVVMSGELGVWAAFVLAGVLARIKTIHFGVLALADLPGPVAGRTLPVVFAAGRLGAMAAGPIVLLAGPALGPRPVVALAAAIYAATVFLLLSKRLPRPQAEPAVGAYSESEGPVSLAAGSIPPPGPASPKERSLLWAIIVGAVALALGRLALTTQSGAILEQHFAEAELNRVLGIYFMAANAGALVLQISVVSRALGGKGLPLLNSIWSLCYLAAQSLLVFGPPSVLVALGARMVEGELRNAVRTPVANLLYEAMPPERRARSRTVVIGVTVPLASVAGGLLLLALGAHPTALAALGMGAAVLLVVTAWAQNRGWKALVSR